MATQLFLRTLVSDLPGNNSANLALAETRGAASANIVIPTTAGSTTDSSGNRWYSQPLDAQTVTGTLTVNIRGKEAALTVNAGAGILVNRVNSTGITQSTIINQTIPTAISEYSTTDAAKTQASIAIPSTAFAAGDRIMVQLQARSSSGTTKTANASGVTNSIDGPTAGVIGDTYVTFSQSLVWQPGIVLGFNPVWVTGTATTITSAAFSPLAGSLILVESQADGTTTPTISISDSVGLTWTAIGTIQRGGSGGYAHAWWAYTATAQTNMTASVNWGSAVSKAIKVTTYTGTESATAVMSKAQNSSPTVNLTVNVTNTNDGARIAGTAVDWNATGSGSSTDDETAFHIAGAISGMSVREAANTVGTGQTVGLNFQSASGLTPDWGYKVYEIVPLGGSGAGATDVSGGDVGSGTDAGTLATTLTPLTDTGSGVDAGTLAITLTGADTSTATESASLVTITPKAGADTALAVDAGTLLASFTGGETGGSVDSPSSPLSATLTGAETSTRVEAYQLSVVLQSADTGAQTDAGSVAQGATDKSGSDTATAVDAGTLAVTQPTRGDAAGAADVATLVATFTASELSSIVDTVQALAAAHTAADTSSQTEGQTLNAGGVVSGADTSAVVEGRTLGVTLTGADTSTVAENQSVLPTIPQSGSDTSSSVESRTLTVQLTASEIVTAIEGFTLSAGGNFNGADTGTVQESILLTVSVNRGDAVTSVDQGFLTLFKSGADTSTLVDSASLLAQLTLAEVIAAADALAVLTGPKTWDFISADLRAIPGTDADSSVQATEYSNGTQTTEISNGTQISVTVSW